MEVLLDRSIELLGAVDLLGGGANAPVPPPLLDYARAVERAVAPFRSHRAVALNAQRDGADPDFFHRQDLLLKRSAPPDLARAACWSSGLGFVERSGEWEPWLAAMRDFARESRFWNIRLAALLKRDLDGLSRHLAHANYQDKIERYTGMPYQGHYRIILSPLCARANGLNRVWTRDDGRREIISVLKPDRRPSEDRAFGDRGMDAVAWHELCHGIMDMTVDLYDYDEKDTPFDLGPGLGHNCRNWLHGIREHLVRAVMLRLIARESGEEAAARQFEREEFSARPHLAAFTARLREYEASREKYPTLAQFYPRLRELFPPPPEHGRPVTAGPFYTARQRSLAAAHLEFLLRKSRDERLLLRREALSRASKTAPEPASVPARPPSVPAPRARAVRGSARTRSKPTRGAGRPSKRR